MMHFFYPRQQVHPVPGHAFVTSVTAEGVQDTHSLDVIFLQAFLKIIRLTATTLKTIAISFECHFIAVTDIEAKNLPELPALTELSINYRAPTDKAFKVALFSMAPPLRSLKYLDLSSRQSPSLPTIHIQCHW